MRIAEGSMPGSNRLAMQSNGRQPKVRSVCAVVVTYHLTWQMIENLAHVLAQTQGLVVVDNGSSADELAPLRSASQALDFHLIENGENLGIAEALNQGVSWAKNNNYPWVILFDQDSRITENFIDQMFATWESRPSREFIATIQPQYVDPVTSIKLKPFRAADGSPFTAMTSGALMPAWVFDEIGLFASEYFIDFVDWEYSLRIRAAGYLIAESNQAVLLHSAGHPKQVTFLGFKFNPSHHSAMRRYYMSRNRVVIYRKYFRMFPRWTLRSLYYDFLRETIKCLLVEKNRIRKLRNFLLGTWDGVTGKMGRRNGI
jgi:rhamnosyltransferase